MFRSLRHLFVPHHTNNHRAKLLHNTTLIILVAVLLTSSLFIGIIKKTHPDILGVSYSISEGDLISLVNAQRAANGQAPLTENSELDDAARRKAADMFAKNYWAHFAPDGSTSPWMFIKAAGYDYTYAGENLAKGFTDAPSIVTAWMNSPTHRENLLSSNFHDEGFAIVPGTLQGEDTVLVVEMFGSRNGGTPSVSAAAENVTPAPSQEVNPTQVPAAIAGEKAKVITLPTPTVTAVPTKTPPTIKAVASSKPLIDIAKTAKTISTFGLILIILVLMLDIIIVEKKKIPRIVGHNIDHIIIISLFLLFIVLTLGGSTL